MSVQVARQTVAPKPRCFSVLVLLARLVKFDIIAEEKSLAAKAKLIAPRDAATDWKLLFPCSSPAHRSEIEAALEAGGIRI